MKTTKLIIDGKEIEIRLSEEDLNKLIVTNRVTGYERAKDENYYHDNGYMVVALTDTDVPTTKKLYDNANYYSNINIANNNARADKLMRQLRRFAVEHREKDINWTDDNTPKFYIFYDYEPNEIRINDVSDCRGFGQIYFDTEEAAELAVETFKDELTWYFTEYCDSL